MSRTIYPLRLNDDEHQSLSASAKASGKNLREFVESIVIVYMAQINNGEDLKFTITSSKVKKRTYAISNRVACQIKEGSKDIGVSQSLLIYNALMWHLCEIKGKQLA